MADLHNSERSTVSTWEMSGVEMGNVVSADRHDGNRVVTAGVYLKCVLDS